MGIPSEGSANIFMDNESVVKSSMNPDTCLKKNMYLLHTTSPENRLQPILLKYFLFHQKKT